MDVISPVAACPHCGLPLDSAPAVAPAPVAAPDAAEHPAVAAEAPPPAPVDADEAVWSDPWAAFVIDEPEYAPAEAPAPPVSEPAAPEDPPVAEPAPPRFEAINAVPAAAPAVPSEPPSVAEFAPLYVRAEEPAPPAAEPEVADEDPWITVPPEPIAAAVESTPPIAGPHVPDQPAERFVVDTGRGWGIRDVTGDPEAASPATTPVPQLGEPALAQLAQPQPAPAARRTRHLRLVITGVAVLVLGAVTYAGVGGGAIPRLFGSTSPVAAPAAIGSLTRVSGAETEALLTSVQSKVHAASSTQAVAAVYGIGSRPQLVFVAYSGAATQTPDQLVAAVNASGTPFTQTPTVSSVGGQPYVCGRVGATATPSVICTWTDSRAAGFVYAINSSDVGGALHFADVARVASESAR